jgi:hypothetical protein
MDFVDQQLVRLADPSTRDSVFDAEALEQLVVAAYDATAMSVEGPFTATFEEFRMGVAAEPRAALEGIWNPVGGVDRTEAHFSIAGFGSNGFPRVDALWRGSIVARFAPAGDPITQVVTTTPDANTVDAQITFAPPRAVSTTAKPLPIAAALLIRDADGLSIAQLLVDSKSVRERLRYYGIERPSDPELQAREPLLVIWLVPQSLFDDADWPGGASGTPAERRAGRRAAAGEWLAREGVGLVAIP